MGENKTDVTKAAKNIEKPIRCEIYHDNFENSRSYNIPRAQMIIADIPFALGDRMYASNPKWYKDGDNKNGESSLAHKAAFDRDYSFNINNFFAFSTRLLRKEPGTGEKGAPCVLIFCSFEQMHDVITEADKNGFRHAIPLVFVKNYSPSVLKANQRIVSACEYGAILYRNKLPKFNNISEEDGKHHMVFNWFQWVKDGKDIPRIHPTQKPVNLLKHLITIFTDPGDVLIDPCCGSGSTLYAARELGRSSFGFEVSRDFYTKAKEQMLGMSEAG